MSRRRHDENEFFHFDSLRALADAFERENVAAEVEEADSDWAGGTRVDALAHARNGDISHVSEAESYADRMLSQLDMGDLVPRWEPDVVGNMPIVPNYLAGVPESMMARHEVVTESSPIEIWANTTVSGTCSARSMIRRGVITLAFAIAIERIRPARIVLFSTTDAGNVAIRLSSPIDVSEVCAAFCRPSITRQLIYRYVDRPYKASLGWSSWSVALTGNEEREREALMRYAGMPENAIHLSTERLGDYADLSDEEIIDVLNSKVRKAMEVED